MLKIIRHIFLHSSVETKLTCTFLIYFTPTVHTRHTKHWADTYIKQHSSLITLYKVSVKQGQRHFAVMKCLGSKISTNPSDK